MLIGPCAEAIGQRNVVPGGFVSHRAVCVCVCVFIFLPGPVMEEIVTTTGNAQKVSGNHGIPSFSWCLRFVFHLKLVGLHKVINLY